MTKNEIVDAMARERRVEAMVENIAGRPLAGALKDLAQMVYLAILEYDEDKIVDLWTNGGINFFIARIIVNQYRSNNSEFYKKFIRYDLKTEQIENYRERIDAWRERGPGISGLQGD